jgi:hypothetical protein
MNNTGGMITESGKPRDMTVDTFPCITKRLHLGLQSSFRGRMPKYNHMSHGMATGCKLCYANYIQVSYALAKTETSF